MSGTITTERTVFRPLMSLLLHSSPVLYDAYHRSVWMLRLPSWRYDKFGHYPPCWWQAVLLHTENVGWKLSWTRITQ